MAIEDDIRKRREQKKKYAEEDEEERRRKSKELDSNEQLTQEKLNELYDRAERMVEQVNGLYLQFFSGVEGHPPKVRREQLDQLMAALQIMPKPTEVYRFRYQSLNGTYVVYRNKWERQLKDLESGKLKRVVRPRMKSSSGS
jgi:hypothetical protein